MTVFFIADLGQGRYKRNTIFKASACHSLYSSIEFEACLDLNGHEGIKHRCQIGKISYLLISCDYSDKGHNCSYKLVDRKRYCCTFQCKYSINTYMLQRG